MKLKVCGMRDADNLAALVELKPEFIGFIFYDKSPRFVGDMDEAVARAVPKSIKKVGVFVNATPEYVLRMTKKYELQFAQLHGQETPDFCRQLKMRGVNIIKAFAIDESFNFTSLNNFKPHTDFFLFDTKGAQPGGNGEVFDWNLLRRYDNDKPFFLSGGLSLQNIDLVSELEGMKVYGLDINSKFETAPAQKDIEKIAELIAILRPVQEEIEA
ncbi:MAG: phosphoribosylanthranilate isomerase [Runella slithyformis]|nr:MAG: phosphoribosylanthranilate isomerase [Runella slithyformis]TAF97625.1 MAG: phosphoribosylanthranilate isomerase [Runella sp.]TAG22531.1 MAG: phosphoribosylanthranilate isomerase [Cytophagales bacterium]TAG41566.1 MAG: phosphoribosylanthranilate isomerase [Cytophagia bacterium]TAF02781.1 MAG: phosphoribosylanthranilate isomerase [Runella slithyformis]